MLDKVGHQILLGESGAGEGCSDEGKFLMEHGKDEVQMLTLIEFVAAVMFCILKG